MLHIFHFLVTGEMAEYLSVKQVIVERGRTRTAWRMLQHLKVQLVKVFNNVAGECEELHYNATLRQLSEIVSLPKLALPHPQKYVNITFPADVQF
jgi:hypothetical protein